MKRKRWVVEDNSMVIQKARLRVNNLPKAARVLDLFCGSGEMYNRAYRGRVEFYRGVDKEKIHDSALCTLVANEIFIAQNDLNTFNVFDLDDYGTPWKQMYQILRKLDREEVTLFVTDGLVGVQRLNGKVTKFVSATEGMSRRMNVPALSRWYADMFATMLLNLEKRYAWGVSKACYFYNERQNVCYWCINLKNVCAKIKEKECF